MIRIKHLQFLKITISLIWIHCDYSTYCIVYIIQGIENEDILISGESKTSVGNACSRILLIVESSRSKMEHTHFISIPFNSKEMQNALLEFKHDVLKKYGENTNEGNFSNVKATNRTIDESLFQTPSLLHLTIGVLSLMG